MSTTEESAVDVSNMDNSAMRWKNALNYYRENCANIRGSRSKGKVRCVAIMDISYSMDGKRLICVKLGLCSLLANFEADDEMNVIAFAKRASSVTGGFKAVSDLVNMAPQFLHSMLTDGCTACYDAIVQGIGAMRDRSSLFQSFATSTNDAVFKNVAIVLTDGEDNESVHTPRSVEKMLVHPRMSNFMFLMVAVDMTKQWERKFRSWMDLNHCKQVRVNVRTGSSLVGVFKEMILCRILETESTSVRFLQKSATEDVNNLSEEQYFNLRAMNLRQDSNGAADEWEDGDEDEEDMEGVPRFTRNGSEGVSSVCSCSDLGRDDNDGSSDDDSIPGMVMGARGLPVSSGESSGSDSSFLIDKDDCASESEEVMDHGSVCQPQQVATEPSEDPYTFPSECYCPISHTLMVDPVVCSDGHTYDRESIDNWLATHTTSPNTNEVLQDKQLIPNHSMRNLIQAITSGAGHLPSTSIF